MEDLSERLDPATAKTEQIIANLVDSSSQLKYPKLPLALGRCVLEMQNVSTLSGLQNVTFCVHRHEIFGIWGASDSLKEHIGRVLFGIEQPSSGQVRLDSQAIHFAMPKDAIHHGIGYLPLEASLTDLFDNLRICGNITIANLAAVSRMGVLLAGSERMLPKE